VVSHCQRRRRLTARDVAGYSEAEIAKTFTLAMLIVRLLVGAISSLCAGFVAAWITNRSVLVIKSLGGVLVVTFLPVITLFERFPPWYHVIFRLSRGGHAAWLVALSPSQQARRFYSRSDDAVIHVYNKVGRANRLTVRQLCRELLYYNPIKQRK
jgi:hypothetical protein